MAEKAVETSLPGTDMYGGEEARGGKDPDWAAVRPGKPLAEADPVAEGPREAV